MNPFFCVQIINQAKKQKDRKKERKTDLPDPSLDELYMIVCVISKFPSCQSSTYAIIKKILTRKKEEDEEKMNDTSFFFLILLFFYFT